MTFMAIHSPQFVFKTFPGRRDVVVELWRNRRCEEYLAFLSAALEQGYSFVRIQDVYESGWREESKYIIVRHDVDQNTRATRTLSSIERAHGVVGTYYFRWSTVDRRLIRDLLADGHEVSLHYETLSDYYKARRLNPRRRPVTEAMLAECVPILQDEIGRFKQILGECGGKRNVKTIASHGDRVNRVLGVPNNRVFEAAPSQFAGIMEAYDRTYLSQLDMHISDSPLWICNGFRYGLHPLDALSRHPQRVQLLLHPIHWDLRFTDKVYESLRACIRGVSRQTHVFQQ
jgi:hypothetical protein